jgi:membrane associated rhomboid family serine protease
MILPLHDDNPTRTRPIVTIGLILACVLVFIWQITKGPEIGQRIVYALGAIPAVLLGHRSLPPELAVIPPAASMITSMFLHGGLWHLLGNMLYLWIFGNNVEDAMGHGRFVVFYVICGIAAVLAQALPDPTSTVPMVGASGAISGVLGAYMLLYPHARVLLGLPLGFFIFQLGRFPAVWVLALWFIMQLVMHGLTPTGGDAQGGVAFRAHIGGFVAGMVLIPFMKHRNVSLWRGRR